MANGTTNMSNYCFLSRSVKYCHQCVCLSVCLLEYLKNHTCLNFIKFSAHAVDGRGSDNNAICYVLAVLWMTTFSHNEANGAEPIRRCYVRLSSPGGGTNLQLHSTHRGQSLPSSIASFNNCYLLLDYVSV